MITWRLLHNRDGAAQRGWLMTPAVTPPLLPLSSPFVDPSLTDQAAGKRS